MSTVENSEHAREIIIVRHRGGDHDDAPHGGVWKIAFADFMTAMMCFFLVMWLINAANEQTKAAVASYFNPVRLIDRNASRKGLEDLGDGPRDAGLTADSPEENTDKSGQGNDGASSSSQKQKSKAAAKPSDSAERRLFADPYAVLAEIATDTAALQNVSEKGDGGAQAAGPATGASGGTSYRDPFAPDFWSQQMATPLAETSAERARIEGDPAKPGDKVAEVENPKVKAVAQPAPVPNTAPLEALAKGETTDAWKKPPESQVPDRKAAEEEKEPAAKSENTTSGTALKAATEIRQQLAQAFKAGDTLHDGVSVEATDKGVVISITDRMDFGMFKIGSALPNRDLVLAMDKIGRIVNGQKGKISIKGHTDARPFRSENYDNWRLSTARAQSAYYMLVRGGVDERRIVEVAGFADRQPKDAADPLAAVNRRIEIFLETGG
ncbi:MAG: MotB family protein [Mesorhizobium sp.]